jgi:hypothetical protein
VSFIVSGSILVSHDNKHSERREFEDTHLALHRSPRAFTFFSSAVPATGGHNSDLVH